MTDTAEIRVLHVDDDRQFAELSARVLEREDDRFTVETAPDAATAVERLAERDVDCVVSDYDMPEMDGLELLGAVREDRPELPFVLFTGKGSEEVASEAISAGVTDYLQKRAGNDQFRVLANRVENAVERYRAERELDRERERFSALFDNFPEPTVAYTYEDDVPIVETVNEAFVETFGYGSETATGTPIDDLVVPPDRREEAKAVDERARAGEQLDAELVRRTVEGTRHFRLRNITLDLDEGPDGFAVYTDVSELKATETALRRQNERLARLASVLGRDLQDSVSAVAERVDDADCENAALEEISSAIDGIDGLVEEALRVARPSASEASGTRAGNEVTREQVTRE